MKPMKRPPPEDPPEDPPEELVVLLGGRRRVGDPILYPPRMPMAAAVEKGWMAADAVANASTDASTDAVASTHWDAGMRGAADLAERARARAAAADAVHNALVELAERARARAAAADAVAYGQADAVANARTDAVADGRADAIAKTGSRATLQPTPKWGRGPPR